jgi:hypothetical protein
MTAAVRAEKVVVLGRVHIGWMLKIRKHLKSSKINKLFGKSAPNSGHKTFKINISERNRHFSGHKSQNGERLQGFGRCAISA